MSKKSQIAQAALRTMISLAGRPKMSEAMRHEYDEAAKIYGRWLVEKAIRKRARRGDQR